MQLLNISVQLMQIVVPLMLHSPKDQYCLHDYELHDQKFKTKCYL